jgi:hypothetical protein
LRSVLSRVFNYSYSSNKNSFTKLLLRWLFWLSCFIMSAYIISLLLICGSNSWNNYQYIYEF